MVTKTMRFPWISRYSHEAMVALFTAQAEELKSERKLLWDRLATMGMGGPVFSAPASTEPVEEEDAAADEMASRLERLVALRKRPTKLAEELARQASQVRENPLPKVAWIPDGRIAAALDQAEESGKKQG
jgi:hypothetical protein